MNFDFGWTIPLNDVEKLKLNDLQNKLDDMYKLKAEGAFVWSRQKWQEYGEQLSAYVFNLEKSQAKYNSILQLNINGTVNKKDI